jgi:hypothetical protein
MKKQVFAQACFHLLLFQSPFHDGILHTLETKWANETNLGGREQHTQTSTALSSLSLLSYTTLQTFETRNTGISNWETHSNKVIYTIGTWCLDMRGGAFGEVCPFLSRERERKRCKCCIRQIYEECPYVPKCIS